MLLNIERVYLLDNIELILYAIVIAFICDFLKGYLPSLYKPSIVFGALMLSNLVLYHIGLGASLAFLCYLIPIVLGILAYGSKGGIITYFICTLSYAFILNTQIEKSLFIENIFILGLSTLGFCYFAIKKAEISFENEKWLEKLHAKINELSLLREITNSMQTTTELKKINKIVLTAITAGYGLGFNRAAIFLVEGNLVKGKTAIGPPSRKEAYKIWGKLVRNQATLKEVIEVEDDIDETLSDYVRKVKLDLYTNEKNPIIRCIKTKTPLNIKNANKEFLGKELSRLAFENYAVVPLISKNQSIGVILVDNRFNEKIITEEDVDSLVTFANQSALAIENIKLYEQVSQLAITDGLTSTYNHRYFKEQLRTYINKNQKFSLLVIDIDDFKLFNEEYGHTCGDNVLTEVGKNLKEVIGTKGIVCRYGGDEFTVLLPNQCRESSKEIALNIQKSIKGVSLGFKGIVKRPLTLSIGLALYPDDSVDEENLFKMADGKLKISKVLGKDTVS